MGEWQRCVIELCLEAVAIPVWTLTVPGPGQSRRLTWDRTDSQSSGTVAHSPYHCQYQLENLTTKMAALKQCQWCDIIVISDPSDIISQHTDCHHEQGGGRRWWQWFTTWVTGSICGTLPSGENTWQGTNRLVATYTSEAESEAKIITSQWRRPLTHFSA